METNIESEAYQTFVEATQTLNNTELKNWKRDGGKVVGYFCSTVPEEVFTAAGLAPFRMRATGSTNTELSDACFSNINCSFPRHAMNLALEGEFDFLDGMVCLNSCDHVRRIYDNWIRNLDTHFVKVMSLPRKVEQPQIEWYDDEIKILIKDVEESFDVEITQEKLNDAIKLHNEVRELQKEVFRLRTVENPPLNGVEALNVIVAGTAIPKARYKVLLEQFLKDMEGVKGKGGHRVRVMIVGGELDDPEFINVIENEGALVVTDSTCFGTRLFWRPVSESYDDPVTALANYYIFDRPSCPRMTGDQERRMDFTLEMAKEFKVDGVIGERLLFCDQWSVEHYMNNNDLKKAGIPFLQIDREYILSGKGQLSTRVQAFIETLEGKGIKYEEVV